MQVLKVLENFNSETRKRRIRLIAGLFFGLLIVITLFSNTILALTLPKVITEPAISGMLDITFTDTAILKPAVEVHLSNQSGLSIVNVLVKEGDAVKKGQTLVAYDSSEAERQLEAERNTLKKLELQVERLQYDFIGASRSEDQAAIISARIALETTNLDISAQEKRIQALQSQLSNKHQLVAPFDGVVLAVNAIVGLQAVDIHLSSSDGGLQFDMEIPANLASSLREGDPLEVRPLDDGSRSIQGRIVQIEEPSASVGSGRSGDDAQGGQSSPLAGTNRLMVRLYDEVLRGGDRVQVELYKAVSGEAVIISSKAVQKDRDGAYVFTIDSRSGPLGNVYYASKRPIEISSETDLKTAVINGLYEGEKVIVESSVLLQDGIRVRY